MRYFLFLPLALPKPLLALRIVARATKGALVASAGRATGVPPGQLGAGATAIPLTTITAAADLGGTPAPGTEKQAQAVMALGVVNGSSSPPKGLTGGTSPAMFPAGKPDPCTWWRSLP